MHQTSNCSPLLARKPECKNSSHPKPGMPRLKRTRVAPCARPGTSAPQKKTRCACTSCLPASRRQCSGLGQFKATEPSPTTGLPLNLIRTQPPASRLHSRRCQSRKLNQRQLLEKRSHRRGREHGQTSQEHQILFARSAVREAIPMRSIWRVCHLYLLRSRRCTETCGFHRTYRATGAQTREAGNYEPRGSQSEKKKREREQR